MTKEIIKETLENGAIRYGYYNSNNDLIFHRDDGPALINPNGTQSWYINGKLHCEDGPAIIYPSGTHAWWINGKLHCEDGPAVIWSYGRKHWYINGKEVTYEVKEWFEERNITDYKDMTNEDKLALTFFMRSLV